MIFDTHAHYDDSAFDEDRDILLENLRKKNVRYIINSSVDIPSSLESIKLTEKYSYIYAAVGIHPQNIDDELENDYQNHIENMIKKNKKVVAIGEIGLDYHFDSNEKSKQKIIFEDQIKLSLKYALPIIVHDREAHKDTIETLKKYNPKGIVHCFSGSVEMAKELVKLGMYLGIGGVSTFKNAKNIIETIKEIPIENLVLETDAPYLAPEPLRGTRCDSSLIKYVAEKISAIKNINVQEVYEKTFNNAVKIFNISNGENL